MNRSLRRLRLLRLGVDSRQDWRVLVSRHLARDARLLVGTHLDGLLGLLDRIVDKKGASDQGAQSLLQTDDGVTVSRSRPRQPDRRTGRKEACVTRGLVCSEVRPGKEILELRDKVAGRKINFSSRVRSRARSVRSRLDWAKLMGNSWK